MKQPSKADLLAELETLRRRVAELPDLNALPYMVITTDPQGVVQTVNALAEQELGRPASALMGHPFPLSLFEPDELKRHWREATMELRVTFTVEDTLFARARHGQVERSEWNWQAFNRRFFPVELTVTARRNAANELIGFILIANNIMERKSSEEVSRLSEERFRAIAENSVLAISYYDRYYRLLYINPAGAHRFNLTPADMIGKTIREAAVEPGFADFAEHCLQQVFDTGEIYETDYVVKDRHFDWWLAPEFDRWGKVVSVVGTSLEVTEHVHTEEALRVSESRFRAMSNASPLGIFVTDVHGHNVYTNRAYQHITHLSASETLGTGWLAAIHPEDVERIRGEFNEVRATNQADENVYRLQHPDGRVIWASGKVAPMRDGETLLGYVGTLEDITARTEMEGALRAGEERFRAMSDASPLGIFVDDSEGNCIYINAAYEKILGMRAVEALGTGWKNALHPEDRHRPHDAWDEATKHLHFIYENTYRFVHADGELVWASGKIAPMRDGETLLGYVGTMENITQRVQTEATLRQRSEELSAANAALAKAAKLKDEFLASMSHELRTPLTGILALAEALQKQVYGPLTPKQLKSLHTIEESGRHLLDLITDILDLSKIEAGRFELQIGLNAADEICQASLRLVRQMAQAKKQSVSYSLSPMDLRVQTDPRRLKQMLVNLLSNAVKFTPEGGALGLQVEGDATHDQVRFSVWDKGIGIAADDMPRLFHAFVQLDSSLSRQYAGTGLGLTLVQRMAELHGGGITVESEVGHGSRFTITLPWHSTSPTIDAPEKFALPALPQLVLLVEDSLVTTEQITRYLQEMGVQSVSQALATGLVDKAAELQPGVILLDLYLPDKSGWDALHELKADPRTQKIPVVITSVMEDRARALELGATAYLVKPVSLADLHSTLSQIARPSPMPPPTPWPAAPPVASRPATATASLLLAEDNETNISILSDYLESQGYQVTVARHGAEAVERALQAPPDLILMDIQMPGMDGLEATRRVRAEPALAQVPIIALTALAMPGDRERCLAAGANDYLMKPVSLDVLIKTINTHLK